MHAGRVLSLKRKRSLERTRSRNRLQRGQTNGDLSQSGDDPLQDPNPNAPWYAIKWDERRRAFQSAKVGKIRKLLAIIGNNWHIFDFQSTRGLSLFHMFALVALIGVGLMVGSLFVGPATGLLEIGVSALLFSLFCLIFVRCDAGDGDDKYVGVDPGSSLVIEEKVVGDEVKLSQDSDDGTRDSLLTRSNPRKIPSPLRVFGYEMNFSPILECSEPGSSVSSFLTRREGSEIPSRLANSSTTDSLSRVSSRGSGVSGGQGPGNGAGSPINEELEDFDYDQQLQLKLDFMGE